MKAALKPTGKCFDDALDFLEHMLKTEDRTAEIERYRLVHGIMLDDQGQPYSHAWVEYGEWVFHGCFLGGIRGYAQIAKVEYYPGMKVQETREYTIPEAWAENRRTGHYGPWEARFRDLCADIQRARAEAAQ